MNCINTKSKEFQELLEASKLPSLLLEMRIAKWQEQNGLDNFPKVEDIIEPFIDYFEKQNLIEIFNLNNINNLKNLLFELNKINSPYPHLEVLKELEKILDFSKIKFKIKELKKAEAHYVEANKTITYDSKNLNDYYPLFFIETITHEVLHAITRNSEISTKPIIGIIQKSLNKQKINLKDYYSIKELYNLVLKSTNKTSNDHYGLTNVEEFISEAYSNEDFQSFLKSIVIEKENNKTSFEKFYEILLKILSLNFIKNNILEKNKNSFEILKDIDKKSIKSLIDLTPDYTKYHINKVNLYNSQNESTIFMKKDLSEFESEENESIFSESILENRAEQKVEYNSIIDKIFPDLEKVSFTSTINKLERLFINNNDPFIADVLSKLSKLKSSSNLFLVEKPSSYFKDGVIMAYDSDTKQIYYNKDVLKGYNNSTIISTLLHELTHHITVDLLSKPYNTLTLSEKDFVDTIKKFYTKYKELNHNKGKDAHFSYGFENIFEFVAEFYSNPDFRNYTKTISESWYNNFIKFITDNLRRLLNISKSSEFDKLMSTIFEYVENNELPETEGKNLYVNKNIFAKQIKEAETYDLTTIDKKADHLVKQINDKIRQLINRTKKSKKEGSEKFLESFKALETELNTLSSANKFKAITAYINSFYGTLMNLNNQLDDKFSIKNVIYNNIEYSKVPNLDAFRNKVDNSYIIPEDVKDKIDEEFFKTNNFIIDNELYNNIENKAIENFNQGDYLDIAFAYEDYLSAYDLLNEVDTLISDTAKDSTLSREDKLEIKELKNKLSFISKPHNDIISKIKKLKKDSVIKLLSDPSNNKKVINKWKNKLSLEYDKISNPKESKIEWIGYQMANTYADEIKKDLEQDALSIINNPYMDISKYAKTWSDLLNINSPLINIATSIIGKMRDKIINKIHEISFVFDKEFSKYSKFNNSTSMFKKYGNLVELNENNDRYYLKGKYSIKFKQEYDKFQKYLKEKYGKEEGLDPEVEAAYKKEWQDWKKENLITSEKGNTIPHPKYLNKNLSKEELELLEFFQKQTKDFHTKNYKGRGGLYSTLYGAEFYKLPSKTKSSKERTLEGDIKGQVIDFATDITKTKVDDINYGEAFDSKGNELQRVKINYRGKLESKDQSLDLFTVYRAEAINAISYKERVANEYKLKLFLDIARDKQYKRKSLLGSGWAKNMFSNEDVKGQTMSGEFSNELEKLKGILETHLYDITSYNEEKLFGKGDLNKLAGKLNGVTGALGMTLNLGSATVNTLNGQMMLMMERFGGKYINKSNLSKAEINYTKSLPSILADISNPVKKSFHNQMLNMFDILGGMNISKQDFLNNSAIKEILSKHNLNFMNDSVEHMLNSVLTESILRSIPVMNKDYKYIDKEGNITSKENAASIFDMLYLDENGILKTKEYFKYSEYNLVDDYHTTGKQSINFLIKKNIFNMYGVYDNNYKSEISKHWYGKLIMMFKNFFLSQAQYRWKGLSTAHKSKNDLTDEDLTFNYAEQEFTEGTYITIIRTFFPLLKGLNIAMVKENLKNLSDYEKHNLRKAFLEISLTAIILPILGALLAASAGDDDDEVYFLLYSFRRLESELSQFRNPIELNRMITNPIAANRFLQNGFQVINDIFTPINFTPKENESYFDWLSENSKGDNIMLNNAFKLAPGKSLFMNTYKQRYSLINK
jgi:predicted SprT family Zn-dependent metalloprotease